MTLYIANKDFIIADKVTHLSTSFPRNLENERVYLCKKHFVDRSKLIEIRNNPNCKLMFMAGSINVGFQADLYNLLSDSSVNAKEVYNSIKLTFELTDIRDGFQILLLSEDNNVNTIHQINVNQSTLEMNSFTLDSDIPVVLSNRDNVDIGWLMNRPSLLKNLTPLDLLVYAQSISGDYGDLHSSYDLSDHSLAQTVRLSDAERKRCHKRVLSNIAKIQHVPLFIQQE